MYTEKFDVAARHDKHSPQIYNQEIALEGAQQVKLVASTRGRLELEAPLNAFRQLLLYQSGNQSVPSYY